MPPVRRKPVIHSSAQAAIHPKVAVAAVVGAALAVLTALIPGLDVDPAVAAAIVTVVSSVASYFTKA